MDSVILLLMRLKCHLSHDPNTPFAPIYQYSLLLKGNSSIQTVFRENIAIIIFIRILLVKEKTYPPFIVDILVKPGGQVD